MEQMVFPMARNSDPMTSHQAAEAHVPKLSERRRQTLSCVADFEGMTSGELARAFYHKYGKKRERPEGLPIRTCVETPHKRLPELEALGLVFRSGGDRHCKDSGQPALEWYTTIAGREELE